MSQKLPNRIYLQAGGLEEDKTLDITWCKDRINDDDTEYARVDTLIPDDEAEKQAFFIANIRQQLDEKGIEMLCKYLAASHIKDIGIFVQHVEQLRDAV